MDLISCLALCEFIVRFEIGILKLELCGYIHRGNGYVWGTGTFIVGYIQIGCLIKGVGLRLRT